MIIKKVSSTNNRIPRRERKVKHQNLATSNVTILNQAYTLKDIKLKQKMLSKSFPDQRFTITDLQLIPHPIVNKFRVANIKNLRAEKSQMRKLRNEKVIIQKQNLYLKEKSNNTDLKRITISRERLKMLSIKNQIQQRKNIKSANVKHRTIAHAFAKERNRLEYHMKNHKKYKNNYIS